MSFSSLTKNEQKKSGVFVLKGTSTLELWIYSFFLVFLSKVFSNDQNVNKFEKGPSLRKKDKKKCSQTISRNQDKHIKEKYSGD